LVNDVVVRWGEMQRSPLKQVLKSWTELSFVDPALELNKLFRGEIDPLQFYVEINGPGVFWRGNIRSQSRGVPFAGRVRKERTNFQVFGGLRKIENKWPSENNSAMGLGAALVRASVFAEDILVRTDVQVVDEDNNVFDVKQGIENNSDDLVVQSHRSDSIYDGLVAWGKMTKGMAYKSLSENAIVYESARLLGTGGTFEARDGIASVVDVERDSRIYNADITSIIIEGDDSDRTGFRDLERVSTIVVSLPEDHNLMTEGATIKTLNPGDLNVIQGGPGLPRDWSRGARLFIAFLSGTDSRADVSLGKINPTTPLRVVVDWEFGDTTPNSLEVEMRYRGNDGSVVSETSAVSNTSLSGPTTTQLIDPLVQVKGTNGEVQIRARYVDDNDRVIETLTAQENTAGVEDIEISESNYAYVRDTDIALTGVNARQIILPDLNVINVQPFLVEAAVENAYRPPGTRTAVGKIYDLVGPEYCIRITEQDGSLTILVPTAREVNLTTGVTSFADVEVPVHALLNA
jgi:hypothetical protein